MKIMIELEVDQEAYDKEHGPGSKYWERYSAKQFSRYLRPDDAGYAEALVKDAEAEAKAKEDYAKNYSSAGWHDMLLDIICEGLYDWSSNGWLKIKLDGKAKRECCMTIEGEAHKYYCEAIAGPEPSA